MTEARVSLDTNILIYAVDRSAGERHRIARSLLTRAGGGRGVLTQQVIGEFLNVGRKTAQLDQRLLRRIAAGLCGVFPILPTRRETLFDAFDLAERHVLQFWDAVIVAVCGTNDVTALLTEDMNDGQVVAGVTILNPFRADNEARITSLL